jgi:hypothetical protein
MSSGPNLVNHGSAGGTPINVDYSNRFEHGAPVKVQLSSNYTTVCLPGMPTRPSLTGCAVANLDYPKTILSGTVLTLLKGEADALVTAGKATYV